MLTLRPHHGMCLHFFAGNGYSPEFTRHMQSVKILLEQQNPHVRLVLHADEICSQCPNNGSGVCTSEEKVCRYDRAVMDFCHLHEETEIPFRQFQCMILSEIIRSGNRKKVCGNCQWNHLCNDSF